MATKRQVGTEEMRRLRSYDDGYQELKRRMKANYESPGLRGESTVDAAKAREIDRAVPRGKAKP